MVDSLLPINATDFEKTCEAILAKVEQLAIPIDTLWDPNYCPEPFLPWLAWALAVDQWESYWDLTTKRNLIAHSLAIHKSKGTRAAIERVLNTLGIHAELSEWFEYGGPPYTFKLTAWINANLTTDEQALLNPKLYNLLQRTIDKVKPVRAHYDFRVGVTLDSQLGMIAINQNFLVVPITMALIR